MYTIYTVRIICLCTQTCSIFSGKVIALYLNILGYYSIYLVDLILKLNYGKFKFLMNYLR